MTYFFKSGGQVERLSQNEKFSEKQRKELAQNVIPLKMIKPSCCVGLISHVRYLFIF